MRAQQRTRCRDPLGRVRSVPPDALCSTCKSSARAFDLHKTEFKTRTLRIYTHGYLTGKISCKNCNLCYNHMQAMIIL